MTDILVIKLGGSVLRDEVSLRKAAGVVKEITHKGFRPAIVVSALKGMTDNIIATTKKTNPNASAQEMDEAMSMGERTTARLFASALTAEGLEPIVVDPDSKYWPIVTDDRFTDANPLVEETKRNVQQKIKPLLEEGKVPVMCGFIGRTDDGRITTMGRGGSDTSAVVLGSALGAKEVILIKDVDTVFSSDPDMVEEPIPIGTLDSEEAFALSLGGAKFLHAKALQYKAEGVRIRIASMEHSLFSGTVIDGGSLDLMVELSGERISMIAIIGLKLSDSAALGKILDAVRTNGANLISLGLDPRSLVLHVSGGKDLENKIHSVAVKGGIAKAVSVFEDLSMITVKGSAMETSPGMIQRITQPLARAGINVYALVTISSSIRIFIRKEHADKAVSLLQDALLIAGKKGE